MNGRHFPKSSNLEKQLTEEQNRKWMNYVFFCTLAVVVLEGLYLVIERPALRIVFHIGLSLLVTTAIWFWERSSNGRDSNYFAHAVFPILLLFLSILYLIFFPPGTVPDERHHYMKSYAYANLLLPDVEMTDMRSDDYELKNNTELFDDTLDTDFWISLSQGMPLLSTSNETVHNADPLLALDMKVELPQLKVPPALGIVVGRLLNLSAICTFYLGRLFNCIYGIVLIIIAVRLTPIGKNIFIAVSLLPMTLHLLASYSYDSGYIGLTFILIALLLRLFTTDSRASMKLLIGIQVFTLLISPGKVVYIFIGLVGFAVPSNRFSSRRSELIWKGCLLLIPMGFVLLARMSQFIAASGVVSTGGDGLSHRGSETGHFYTLQGIITHPFDSFVLLLRTFYVMADQYIKTIVGGSLGWFQSNLVAANWQVTFLCLVILLSSVCAPDDSGILDNVPKKAFMLACLICAISIVMSMYLWHTFDTEKVVLGVQGRYLIPFLPCVLLIFRRESITSTVRLAPSICLLLGAFNCLYLAQMCFNVLGGPIV